MATDITVNTSGTILSIAVDKADYPSGLYPTYIDIAIASLKMEKGTGAVPLIITDTNKGDRYPFDTATGTITVSTVAASSTDDLRTKILAAT